MASSELACLQAHKIQTALISQDEGCGKIEVNLILVHAQDHLMNAILCDLAGNYFIKKRAPCLIFPPVR